MQQNGLIQVLWERGFIVASLFEQYTLEMEEKVRSLGTEIVGTTIVKLTLRFMQSLSSDRNASKTVGHNPKPFIDAYHCHRREVKRMLRILMETGCICPESVLTKARSKKVALRARA